MLEVSNVSLPLDVGLPDPAAEALMRTAAARALRLKDCDIAEVSLLKRSVDARKKTNVHFIATLAVRLADASREAVFLGPQAKKRMAAGVNAKEHVPAPNLEIPNLSDLSETSSEPLSSVRPVVAGAGPAGLFCALYLARAGLRPLLVERGAAVDERMRAIDDFAAGGELDPQTNVQFGEGGAGMFSDGKLTTGTKSPHIRHVLQEFVAAGAPREILWQAKPHIGTDLLPGVVKNLREQIIAAGGEVRFNTQLVGLEKADGAVGAVVLESQGAVETVPASHVVLACGHSARDTFAMLRDVSVPMQQKQFAMGVRIEHRQSMVDRAQYGNAAKHPALGAADYKLAVHLPSNHKPGRENLDGRGVYTFCMCPGGEVVAAASEPGGVCVNGASKFARDADNSNSALLVEVRPEDFGGDDVLAGVELQRTLEQAAYRVGLAGSSADAPYTAPAQTVGDFLEGKAGGPSSKVMPSYPRGVAWCDLREVLPPFMCDSIAEALPLLDRKLHGFASGDAVMTAVEARSSSPVRIVRGADFQSGSEEEPGLRGLYPCGEGAGYAGGIMSAAVDGLRVAEAICAGLADGLASK